MKVTRVGWVVIAVLAACAVVALVAGGAARFAALALGVVLLLVLAGEGIGGSGGSRKREVFENRAEVERAGARERQQSGLGL